MPGALLLLGQLVPENPSQTHEAEVLSPWALSDERGLFPQSARLPRTQASREKKGQKVPALQPEHQPPEEALNEQAVHVGDGAAQGSAGRTDMKLLSPKVGDMAPPPQR